MRTRTPRLIIVLPIWDSVLVLVLRLTRRGFSRQCHQTIPVDSGEASEGTRISHGLGLVGNYLERGSDRGLSPGQFIEGA